MIVAHHEVLLAVEAAVVSGLSFGALAGMARRRARLGLRRRAHRDSPARRRRW